MADLDIKHGTLRGYDKGCRCDDCSMERREYDREYQRRAVRRRADPNFVIMHGTNSAYTNHACRCSECKKAASDVRRKNRSKK